MWSGKSHNEDNPQPTPDSGYSTRENEVFEETGYSPSSNPFGQRPDLRTPAGAQAARKRLSLGGEAPGNDTKDSVRGALEDAGLKFSSIGQTLNDVPPLSPPTNPTPQSDTWNVAADNPIYSATATPRGDKNIPLSPGSTKSTPRSGRSLPGSAQKVDANVFPKSFPVPQDGATGNLPGGLAGWMRRQKEFSTRLSGATNGAIGRGADGRGVTTVGNPKETIKAIIACLVFFLLILGISLFDGKPGTPTLTPEEFASYLKRIGKYDEYQQRQAAVAPPSMHKEKKATAIPPKAAPVSVAPLSRASTPAAARKPIPKEAKPLPAPVVSKKKEQKQQPKTKPADSHAQQSITSKIKSMSSMKNKQPPSKTIQSKKTATSSSFGYLFNAIDTQTSIVFASISAVTVILATALRAMQKVALAASKPVVVAPTSTPVVGGRARRRTAPSVSPSRSRSASRGRSASRSRPKKASTTAKNRKTAAATTSKATVAADVVNMSSPRTPRSATKRLSSMEQQAVNQEPASSTVRRGRSTAKKWNRV